MLFLDYDIASKLNFFTDTGDYRLPDSTKFYLTSTASNYSISSTVSNLPLITNTVTTDSITVVNGTQIPLNIEVNLNLNTTSINRLLINLMTPSGQVINLKRNNSGVGTNFSNTKCSSNGQLVPSSNNTLEPHLCLILIVFSLGLSLKNGFIFVKNESSAAILIDSNWLQAPNQS